MSSVVFLRAVNVGTANRCRPAQIATQLSKFDVVNIGAVGTFVVRKEVSEVALRGAFAKKLPFKCEMMICPGRDILLLSASDPFSEEESGSNIVRFASILAKRPRISPATPLYFPSTGDWGMKIVAIRGRFVLGLYRRQMKAISYLGKFEKQLGIPATVRSWNTIEKIVQTLRRE